MMNISRVRTLKGLLKVGLLAVLCIFPSVSFAERYFLEGLVADEQGNAIHDVTLHVRESKFSFFSSSFSKYDEETVNLADGDFSVSCRRCTSVSLHFSKGGFISETIDFNSEGVELQDGRPIPEKALDVIKTEIQVVLRSTQNIAQLTTYSGLLRSNAEGPVAIVPIRPDSRGQVTSEILGTKLDQEVYVQLRARSNDVGELAALNRTNSHWGRPIKPVLDFSAAEGGIILYKLSADSTTEIYREMRTAPSEGYETTLELDTVDINAGDFYFFCRIGDLYGKGRVVMPSFSSADERQGVRAYIEIRLNLAGGSNVETAR